jgi:hypothetical protein
MRVGQRVEKVLPVVAEILNPKFEAKDGHK